MNKLATTLGAVVLAGTMAGTAEAETVEIEPGDTLGKISDETGVSVAELASMNGIDNVDLIYAGQKLEITPDASPEANHTDVAKEVPKQVAPASEAKTGWFNYEFTHYTANCAGCTGVTSTGIDVRGTTHYKGMRVIAVNPNVIPYGSIVELKYPNGSIERAYAGDTGGAIRARTDLVDVLVSTNGEAFAKGRVHGQLRIIQTGGR